MRTLFTSLLLLVVTACAGAPPFDAKAVAVEWAAYMQRDYSLRPGDKLAVQVTQPGSTSTEQDAVQEVIAAFRDGRLKNDDIYYNIKTMKKIANLA